MFQPTAHGCIFIVLSSRLVLIVLTFVAFIISYRGYVLFFDALCLHLDILSVARLSWMQFLICYSSWANKSKQSSFVSKSTHKLKSTGNACISCGYCFKCFQCLQKWEWNHVVIIYCFIIFLYVWNCNLSSFLPP